MKARGLKFGVVFILMLFFVNISFSQEEQTGTISGTVTCKGTGEPLFGVVAIIEELNKWFITDESGYYELKNLPPDEYTIHFERLGIQNKDVTVNLGAGESKEVNVEIVYLSLDVDEVVVTAKENSNKMSTSSVVESQAIEHIQASSLNDVMQLLPGKSILNPDLNNSKQATLRGISSDADEAKIDAMGTAIIMDGAPVSNNANLQASNTAKIGAEGYFSTVSGGGVDLRQIPTDNIESIEVIRGIPSVKHGDLTSGAVLVNTKASVTPFIGKIKFNPNIKQAYLGKGVKLGNNNGSLNLDLDYAYSQADVRMPNPSFNRLNGQLTYTNNFFNSKWYTTSKLSFFRTHDKDRDDADQASLEKRYSTDAGMRFTTSGKLKSDGKKSGCLNYNITASYERQVSYNRILVSTSIKPLPQATVDSTYEANYLPSEYYSGTKIKGEPFNFFSSLDYRFHEKIGEFHNRIMIGGDYKIDANWGEGRTFDPDYYPSSTQRPRSFKDIPALHQFSIYLEDKISTKLFNRRLKMQAGLRFDNVQPTSPLKGEFGQVLLPRFNMAYNVFDNITVRGGYGITSKSPSLIYLYPDNAYFDPLSFNMYSSKYPEESLTLVTTKVYSPDNSTMQLSKMEKYEFGLDLSYKKNSLTLTYYDEKLTGGYSFEDVLAVVPYPVYDIYSYIPGQGQKPVLDYTNVDTSRLRDSYKAPANNKSMTRTGFEFTFNSKKIKSIGTSFNLTGAWTKSESHDNVYDYYIKSQYQPGNEENLIGIYQNNGREDERLLTTLRVIQHIPKLSFIASLSIQTSWIEKYKPKVNNEFPIGYVDQQGDVTYLTSQEAHSDEYSFLKREFDDSYYYESNKPSLWHMSLKLTKELENGMAFSFYANNMFMSHPAYRNIKTGQIEKRNPSLFFGAELKFKI